MAKIVVFGGNGFIGRHLVLRLSEQASDEIFVFDRFSNTNPTNHTVFDNVHNVHVVPGNFFNREEVNEVLRGAAFVFHLISTTNPAASHKDPLIDIDTNIRSSVELFQMCVENNVKKVVFISSGGTVYGNVDSDKISEAQLPNPISPYGIGKLTIEHYLNYFNHIHNLDYVVYRAANPYGPGQNIQGKQGVIPIFMNHFVNKQPITVYGDGSMTRDYIYISDFVEMVTRSYEHARQHVYNIGSGRGTSVNELIEAISDCAQYTIEENHIDVPKTYIQNSVLDTTLFTDEFGIRPAIDLNEGIKKTWEYVNEVTK